MNLDWLVQMTPIIGPALGAAIGLLLGEGKARKRLKCDIEMANAIPEDSPARERLLSHIDDQIKKISKQEMEGERDLGMAAFAALGAAGFGYLTVWLFQQEDWWRWSFPASGLLFLIFSVGVAIETKIKYKQDKIKN